MYRKVAGEEISMMSKKIILFAAATLFVFCLPCYPENIDPLDEWSQYAYSGNVGWFNFEPNQGPGVSVSDTHLTGYVWAENIGWINLDPNISDPNVGIKNDGTGRLSGYAWAENVGWLNFNPKVPNDSNHYGVTIDDNGYFHGWVWGENVGWINVEPLVISDPNHYGVRTSWNLYDGTCWNFATCAGQPFGDATCDGVVGVINLGDLVALKAAWGKSAPYTPPFCCADFNHDGAINLGDLVILKQNWGRTGFAPSTANQTCP
jgi:hypothetical protein